MSSLKKELYSIIFKNILLNTSGHVEAELEVKRYYDPIQLFYGFPCFARLDKCGKNCFS
jgi:hypothetical protein